GIGGRGASRRPRPLPGQRVAPLRRRVALAPAGTGAPAHRGRLLLPGPRPLVGAGAVPGQGPGEGGPARPDRRRAEPSRRAGPPGLLLRAWDRREGGSRRRGRVVAQGRRAGQRGFPERPRRGPRDRHRGVGRSRGGPAPLPSGLRARQPGGAPAPGRPRLPGQAEFDEGRRLYLAGQKDQAARQFLKAAEAGHPRAQLQIGYQYNYGEGVPASATEAVRWYAKAAAQNDATAQANLGDMYKRGTG